MEQYPTNCTSNAQKLTSMLTAKLASYPTLYYVVVTAVRRTKHSDAKLFAC